MNAEITALLKAPDVLQRLARLGVNSYVVKPVDFNALTNVAKQAGYYWLAINRTPDL